MKAKRNRAPSPTPCHSASADSVLSLRPPTGIWSVLTRPVIIAVINYGCLALTNSAYSVLLPLFLSTPIEHGGLGLNPKQIGYILGTQGILSVILRIQKRLGNARSFTSAMAGFVIMSTAFPIMSSMVSGVSLSKGSNAVFALPWGVWIVLAVQISCFGLVVVGYGEVSKLALSFPNH